MSGEDRTAERLRAIAEVADWFEREAGDAPAGDWRRKAADTIRREWLQ